MTLRCRIDHGREAVVGKCGLENVNCTQEEAEPAHSVQAGPSCRFETPPTPLDAFPAIETTMFVLHAVLNLSNDRYVVSFQCTSSRVVVVKL